MIAAAANEGLPVLEIAEAIRAGDPIAEMGDALGQIGTVVGRR